MEPAAVPDQLSPTERPREADPLVVRAIRPSDVEGLDALQSLPGYRFGTLRLPYQSLDEIRKFIENRPAGHVGIVALIDDRIVGAAGLERLPGRRNHAGYLGMGVHDDHVGRGIGTTLLRALLDTADNWLGLKRIELAVFVDNAPAIALYKRHQFEVEGTLRAYAFRNGAFVDAYTMARLRL
jgi:putative acetyltransferase